MTLLSRTHPEDVKAAIRKRFGSLRAFEESRGLAARATSEVFRGRASKRTEEAIEEVLAEEAAESTTADSNHQSSEIHRLNAQEA